MTWRASVVEHDFVHKHVRVVIGREFYGTDEVDLVGAIDATGTLAHRVPVAEHHPEQALYIPDEIARALLDGLAQHYGGTGDTRQLRKDYDAERDRVDRLINSLTVVATRGAP